MAMQNKPDMAKPAKGVPTQQGDEARNKTVQKRNAASGEFMNPDNTKMKKGPGEF